MQHRDKVKSPFVFHSLQTEKALNLEICLSSQEDVFYQREVISCEGEARKRV